MPSAREELNARQWQFCFEYAKGKSGSQAYRDAGYEPSNDQTAASSAHKLLQKDAVQKEVKRIQNARAARAQARKATVVADAFSFVSNQFGALKTITQKISNGVELTDDERMLYSKAMNIVSSLSREDVIKIQQSQAQGQGQEGMTLSDLHQMAGEYEDAEGQREG